MIKRINHVALSVANLDRAAEFYGKALGMRSLSQETAFFPGYEDGKYEAILGLRGATGRVRTIGTENGVRIELFEFMQPRPRASDPNRPVCDHGITHFCIEVEDIESEYLRVIEAGGTFHAPPMEFFGAVKAAYGRDLDGNVFELIELIAGSGDN